MTMTSPTRRAAASLLAAGALVALSACGSAGPAPVAGSAGPPPAAGPVGAPPSAGPTSAAAAEDPTSVFSLEVGQCIDSEADSGQVGSVPVVDCSEPHEGEIYALPQAPDGEFPGEEAMQQTAQDQCVGSAYTDYVGLPYQQSEFEVTFLLPTEESWSNGDREIGCIVQNEEPGSVRGSNR
jgi:predicted small lipoprotein YifL